MQNKIIFWQFAFLFAVIIPMINAGLPHKNAKNLNSYTAPKTQDLSDYQIIMWHIKSFEKLSHTPYWDVCQYTSGWGTKANNSTEYISLNEANIRARLAFDVEYKSIRKKYPKLDKWTALVVSSLSYNVIEIGPQLHTALKYNDRKTIAALFKKYIHANGSPLNGLIKRRNQEARMLHMTHSDKQRYGRTCKKIVINSIINPSS